jgi:hypothetical protein
MDLDEQLQQQQQQQETSEQLCRGSYTTARETLSRPHSVSSTEEWRGVTVTTTTASETLDGSPMQTSSFSDGKATVRRRNSRLRDKIGYHIDDIVNDRMTGGSTTPQATHTTEENIVHALLIQKLERLQTELESVVQERVRPGSSEDESSHSSETLESALVTPMLQQQQQTGTLTPKKKKRSGIEAAFSPRTKKDVPSAVAALTAVKPRSQSAAPVRKKMKEALLHRSPKNQTKQQKQEPSPEEVLAARDEQALVDNALICRLREEHAECYAVQYKRYKSGIVNFARADAMPRAFCFLCDESLAEIPRNCYFVRLRLTEMKPHFASMPLCPVYRIVYRCCACFDTDCLSCLPLTVITPKALALFHPL